MSNKIDPKFIDFLQYKIDFHKKELEQWKYLSDLINELGTKLETTEKSLNLFIKDSFASLKDTKIRACCQKGHKLIFENNKISCMAGRDCTIYEKEEI